MRYLRLRLEDLLSLEATLSISTALVERVSKE